jgi:hypothetical protein
MANPTRTNVKDEAQRRERVMRLIEATLQPSPDSANEIAKATGENVTFVARILHQHFEHKGGRWVYRHNPERHE